MIIKTAPDSDGCIDLLAVLRIMNQVSQEQAWALAYELAALMQRLWPASHNCALIESLAQIHINQEGFVHAKSLQLLGQDAVEARDQDGGVGPTETSSDPRDGENADQPKVESASSKRSPQAQLQTPATQTQRASTDCQINTTHRQIEQLQLKSSPRDHSNPQLLQPQQLNSACAPAARTSPTPPPLPPTPPITPELEEQLRRRRPASSEQELVSSLGIALFWALDYGIAEDEERKLSAAMEFLIMQSQNPEGHLTLAKVQDICIKRLQPAATKTHADLHYRAICKSLISDTLELSLLLDKIYTAKLYAAAAAVAHNLHPHHPPRHQQQQQQQQQHLHRNHNQKHQHSKQQQHHAHLVNHLDLELDLKQLDLHQHQHLLELVDHVDDLSELGQPLASLRALKINDWARLWMQVIRELRQRRKFTQIQFENEQQHQQQPEKPQQQQQQCEA